MSVQAMFRRGGLFQGPRLIASILAVLILILYFSTPVAKDIDGVEWTDSDPGNRLSYDTSAIAPEYQPKDKEPDSFSDKFYEFVGGRGKKNPKATQSATSRPKPTGFPNEDGLNDPFCEVLSKGTEDLLVIVNTPATDLYTQLPSRFLTNLRCAPKVLFSTISHRIGTYKVIDAIANIPEKILSKHKEFDLYRKIQNAQRAFQEFSIYKSEDVSLDKWTVVPSIVEAYKLHPDKKWYVYIEGDTYLSLPNVLSWVGQLDHRKPFYAGSQTTAGETELASASAGIVLSNAAIAALANIYDEKKSFWEEMTSQTCCGDIVLAEMFKDIGISVHRSYPNIQPESPLGVEWSSRHWCKAAVTWHQMTPPLMDMLWQFERNWTLTHAKAAKEAAAHATATVSSSTKGWFNKRAEPTDGASPTEDEDEYGYSSPMVTETPKKVDFTSSIGIPPILFKDYFEGFIVPLVTASDNRTDWDNLSNALTYTDQTRASSYAHSSPDTCRAACDIRTRCVQYVHEPNKCRLATLVRIGEPVPADRHAKSGWLPHRIKKVVKSMGTCSAKPKSSKELDSLDDINDAGAFYMPGFEKSKSAKEEEAAMVKEEHDSAKGLEEESKEAAPSVEETQETPEEAPAAAEEETAVEPVSEEQEEPTTTREESTVSEEEVTTTEEE